MTELLDRRALNRATLHRQLLLNRSGLRVTAAVEHLAGLQAQTPHTWYVGLWSRLDGFNAGDAAQALQDRRLVRLAAMRGTIHLLTAADAAWLRAATQPVFDRDLAANTLHGKALSRLDLAEVAAHGRRLLAGGKPLSNKDLGAALHEHFPDCPPASLVYAVRGTVPLVQVPPRGLWGRSGPIAHTTLEVKPGPWSPQLMVGRYLAAFGPASVKDVQAWCGLTRLKEIVTGMPLATFRDSHGQVLYDLPDAPRPGPDVPAPPRFLYDFDNLLLSYAERSRVLTDGFFARRYEPHGPVPQLLLLDGFTAGDWKLLRDKDSARLAVTFYRRPSKKDTEAVVAEGAALLQFLAPGADHEVSTGTG